LGKGHGFDERKTAKKENNLIFHGKKTKGEGKKTQNHRGALTSRVHERGRISLASIQGLGEKVIGRREGQVKKKKLYEPRKKEPRKHICLKGHTPYILEREKLKDL